MRDERGQAGSIEVLPFAVLVFVVGALMIANAWAVIDAKVAVSAAAREAARTYVEAPNADVAARAPDDAARQAVAGYGRDPADLAVELATDDESFQRCGRVTVTARYRVPALTLPWIGGLGDGFTVRATHTEVVDPFRAGVGGTAACD